MPSQVSPVPAPLAVPFKLGQVALAEGSLFERKQAANSQWLLALSPSNLTCLYTSAVKLTCSTTGVPYECQPTAAMPVRSDSVPAWPTILCPIFLFLAPPVSPIRAPDHTSISCMRLTRCYLGTGMHPLQPPVVLWPLPRPLSFCYGHGFCGYRRICDEDAWRSDRGHTSRGAGSTRPTRRLRVAIPYSSEGFTYLFELQPYSRKYPHVPFYVM
eukprot:SAG11_NODE_10542_length_823_cov_1.277624_1_plen_213_part_10